MPYRFEHFGGRYEQHGHGFAARSAIHYPHERRPLYVPGGGRAARPGHLRPRPHVQRYRRALGMLAPVLAQRGDTGAVEAPMRRPAHTLYRTLDASEIVGDGPYTRR